MQAGLHALVWGLQRAGIALAVIVLVPIVAYILLVVFVVVRETASTFGT